MRKYIAPLSSTPCSPPPRAGAAYAATTAPAPMAKADHSVQSTIKSINLAARSLDRRMAAATPCPRGVTRRRHLKAGDTGDGALEGQWLRREVTGITLG